MPFPEFNYLNKIEIETFNISAVPGNGDTSFILEVDIEYPEKLHNSHCDLPFAPENFIPRGRKSLKLISNFCLILRNIHRILNFRQSNFLHKYIDLNKSLWKATNVFFRKGLFELMNNALFDKTIENRREKVDD